MNQSKEVIIIQGWDDTDQTAFIKEPALADSDTHKLASDILVAVYKKTEEEAPDDLQSSTLNSLKINLFDKIKQFLVGLTDDGLLNTTVYDTKDCAHQVNFTMTRLPVANTQAQQSLTSI